MTSSPLVIALSAPLLVAPPPVDRAVPVTAHGAASVIADGPSAPLVRRPHCRAKRRLISAHHGRRDGALSSVTAANRQSILNPQADLFDGATQVYPYSEGALFRLYAAPDEISDIELQPGEALVSVAAGDTARWVIGETSSGSASARRTHVLVKPVSAGLRTNIIIATDRRIYHVEALSTAATSMATLSWIYPADSLISLHSRESPAPPAIAASAVKVETLDFDYRIEGPNVSWRPVRAFDDGHQVFIQFPPSLADGEAPPLFLIGDDGHADLVNYRLVGRYYVVDRLFGAAELRLGGKHQDVVRIIRADSVRKPGRPA